MDKKYPKPLSIKKRLSNRKYLYKRSWMAMRDGTQIHTHKIINGEEQITITHEINPLGFINSKVSFKNI